jgi:hypothetical protein
VPFSDVDAEEVQVSNLISQVFSLLCHVSEILCIVCAQARIVVAENLPEEHRYQSLMRIFSAVGRYGCLLP